MVYDFTPLLLADRLANEPVSQALVIALEVVMRHELVDSATQGSLPDQGSFGLGILP
jgi:hypothetical protein